MRSRELRPFRVEVKTKRRTPAVLPPSIWGDTAPFFKTEPDRPARSPIAANPPASATNATAVEPIQAVQARRILPDLRTIEVAVAEPAAPLRVKRTPRKKGGNIMLHDTEKMVEHQENSSPTARDNEEPAPAIHIKASSLAISEGDHDIRLRQSRAETAVAQEANPTPTSTPIAMPELGVQPSRRWMKETAELPRWEKWKRRLPQVCR